jgi:hypothetical protein
MPGRLQFLLLFTVHFFHFSFAAELDGNNSIDQSFEI